MGDFVWWYVCLSQTLVMKLWEDGHLECGVHVLFPLQIEHRACNEVDTHTRIYVHTHKCIYICIVLREKWPRTSLGPRAEQPELFHPH